MAGAQRFSFPRRAEEKSTGHRSFISLEFMMDLDAELWLDRVYTPLRPNFEALVGDRQSKSKALAVFPGPTFQPTQLFRIYEPVFKNLRPPGLHSMDGQMSK